MMYQTYAHNKAKSTIKAILQIQSRCLIPVRSQLRVVIVGAVTDFHYFHDLAKSLQINERIVWIE